MKRLLVLLAVAALLSGCGAFESQVGELTISITDNTRLMNVIWPDDSLEAGHYVVSGTGTSGMAIGTTFEETVAVGSSLVKDLPPGGYSLSVQVWNNDSPAIVVGSGSATANVVIGVPASVTVTCAPLAGDGNLFLDMTWQPDVIGDPSVDLTMRPFSGADIEVPVTVGALTTASATATMPAGWYVGLLRIYDGTELNAGIARAVRLAAGSDTHWLEALTVNALTGTLTIDLIYNPGLPLTVTGTAPGTYTAYRGIPLEFSCTGANNDAGTSLLYFWHLDGGLASVGVSATYSLDASSFDAGTQHYLSCIVVQSDGKRAGELQYVLEVEEPQYGWMNVSGVCNDSAFSTGVPYTVELLDATSHSVVDSLAMPYLDDQTRDYDLGAQAMGSYHVRVVIPAGGDFPTGRTVYWKAGPSFTLDVALADVIAVPHALGTTYVFNIAALTP